MSTYSLALGNATLNSSGEILEVWYPNPVLHPDEELVQAVTDAVGRETRQLDAREMTSLAEALASAGQNEQAEIAKALAEGDRPGVLCVLDEDSAPSDVPSAYLKLHLLSHRLVKPHGTDLSGVFGVLPNLAWTNEGAVALDELTQRQMQARNQGRVLLVHSVDKFPKMLDYVVPSGVRIGDGARIRLGAYLGEGTTVMHEGFVNFNAGTEGPNMIEGRISAGVFVGKGSDLGGGCSTMGTLSGGGNVVISVGENCLIGANAGIGIPLGDRCTVEAGLYVTAGTKVSLLQEGGAQIGVIKAAELAGQSDLLFRRNSQTGAIECLTNKSSVELNEDLHKHN